MAIASYTRRYYLGAGYGIVTDFDLLGNAYDTIEVSPASDYLLEYSHQVGSNTAIDTIIKDLNSDDWLMVLQDVQLFASDADKFIVEL